MESLEVETRDGLQRVALDKPRLTIGRLPGNDVVLPYTSISRHHAEVRLRNREWWIIDMSSTNGLHVNGRVVKEHLLRPGDRVMLAPSIIVNFVSPQARLERTVEGTIQLPSIAPPSAPTPAQAAQLTVPHAAAEVDPFERPVDVVASSISVPLPRRKPATAPVSTPVQVPPAAAPPQERRPPRAAAPRRGKQQQMRDEALDAWLRDEQIEAPIFEEKGPSLPPQNGPDDRDLPFDSPFALMRRIDAPPASAAKKPLLVLCPTCHQRTAPDSPYCWNCHQTIAQPCRVCHLYLLPIQAKCPRCDTPNDKAVRR